MIGLANLKGENLTLLVDIRDFWFAETKQWFDRSRAQEKPSRR